MILWMTMQLTSHTLLSNGCQLESFSSRAPMPRQKHLRPIQEPLKSAQPRRGNAHVQRDQRYSSEQPLLLVHLTGPKNMRVVRPISQGQHFVTRTYLETLYLANKSTAFVMSQQCSQFIRKMNSVDLMVKLVDAEEVHMLLMVRWLTIKNSIWVSNRRRSSCKKTFPSNSLAQIWTH